MRFFKKKQKTISYIRIWTVFEFLIDIYSVTGINHTLKETMIPATMTHLVKRSAVYSSQGAALPVNNKALRRYSWESLCSYKYGSCHCYDYFKPSAVTLHCLLPVFCCSVSDNRDWRGQAGFVMELHNSSAAQSKKVRNS